MSFVIGSGDDGPRGTSEAGQARSNLRPDSNQGRNEPEENRKDPESSRNAQLIGRELIRWATGLSNCRNPIFRVEFVTVQG